MRANLKEGLRPQPIHFTGSQFKDEKTRIVFVDAGNPGVCPRSARTVAQYFSDSPASASDGRSSVACAGSHYTRFYVTK